MEFHKENDAKAMFFSHSVWGAHTRNIITQFQRYFRARGWPLTVEEGILRDWPGEFWGKPEWKPTTNDEVRMAYDLSQDFELSGVTFQYRIEVRKTWLGPDLGSGIGWTWPVYGVLSINFSTDPSPLIVLVHDTWEHCNYRAEYPGYYVFRTDMEYKLEYEEHNDRPYFQIDKQWWYLDEVDFERLSLLPSIPELLVDVTEAAEVLLNEGKARIASTKELFLDFLNASAELLEE